MGSDRSTRHARPLGWVLAFVTALAGFAAVGAPLASAWSAASAHHGTAATVKADPAPAPASEAPPASAPDTSGSATDIQPASGGYAFLAEDRGRPVRYDPCTPIHYVVNATFGPPNALADLQEAVHRLSAVTGLTFVYDGPSSEIPAAHRGIAKDPAFSGWPPVLIGWAAPGDSDLFTAGAIGEGGSTWFGVPGHEVYVTGVVVIDPNQNDRVVPGFGGNSLGGVLMHELGHLVGLDHVSDTAQIMYPTVTEKPAVWGAGDLAGLRQLGRSGGCLAEPAPPWRT